VRRSFPTRLKPHATSRGITIPSRTTAARRPDHTCCGTLGASTKGLSNQIKSNKITLRWLIDTLDSSQRRHVLPFKVGCAFVSLTSTCNPRYVQTSAEHPTRPAHPWTSWIPFMHWLLAVTLHWACTAFSTFLLFTVSRSATACAVAAARLLLQRCSSGRACTAPCPAYPSHQHGCCLLPKCWKNHPQTVATSQVWK
jgi:hypothetical protein